MSDPDEFEYGDDFAPGLGARFVALCVLTVFLIAVFGTAVTDTFFPVEGIQLIGAELAEQEELEASAQLWDGSLARRFEDSLREHSRVRAAVLPDYAYLKFAFFDEAPSGIVVGKHHWLFLEKRITLSEWHDRFLADCFGTSMTALERRLLGNGIELVTLPLVRKAYVARDYVPRGYDPRVAVDDLVIEGLKARGLVIADVRALYAAYRPEEVYFELDTHWTPGGARIAAEEMARTAGRLQPAEHRLGQLTIAELDERGAMGLGTLQSVNVDPEEVNLSLLDLREPRATTLDFPPKLRSWFKKPTPDTPAALAGTSFSTAQQFAELLTHFSGEPVFDGAVAARPYMMNVARVIERYGDSHALELLYFETPLAPPFIKFNQAGAYYTEAVGRVFGAAPPERWIPLESLRPKWVPCGIGEDTALKQLARTPLVVIPTGVLTHTGDGVACIRLAGEVKGSSVLLRLTCDASTYLHRVEPGPFEFSLPIIAQGATAAGLQVLADRDPAASIRIDAAQLVHQPVGDRMVSLTVESRDAAVELRPRKSLLLGRRAALIVQLGADGQRLTDLLVRVRTSSEAPPREFRFERTVPGASIAIDLGAAHGESLLEVELSAGQGRIDVAAAGVTSAE